VDLVFGSRDSHGCHPAAAFAAVAAVAAAADVGIVAVAVAGAELVERTSLLSENTADFDAGRRGKSRLAVAGHVGRGRCCCSRSFGCLIVAELTLAKENTFLLCERWRCAPLPPATSDTADTPRPVSPLSSFAAAGVAVVFVVVAVVAAPVSASAGASFALWRDRST